MASTNPMYTPWESLPYKTDLIKIQAIVNYCASRFRAAAAALSKLELMECDEIHFGHFTKEVVCVRAIVFILFHFN